MRIQLTFFQYFSYVHIDVSHRGGKQGGNLLLVEPNITIASHKSHIHLTIFRTIDDEVILILRGYYVVSIR